jgi:hypothetical protein
VWRAMMVTKRTRHDALVSVETFAYAATRHQS